VSLGQPACLDLLAVLYLRHAIPKEEVHSREAPGVGRASLMRARATIISASDEKSAEAAALAEFKIGEDPLRRLIVRPNDGYASS